MEQENSVLLERWINYKNEEAERVNQQNASLGKDPRLSQQEQQVSKKGVKTWGTKSYQNQAKIAQDLTTQGRAIMLSKSKTSLLDSGAETGFVTVS